MQLYWPERNRSFGPADAIGLMGLLGLLVARFIPVARLIPFWGCQFRKVTGIPCPGCGLTRVADRFAHFHFLGALEANPLGTVAAAFFAVMIIWSALHLTFKVPIPEPMLSDREWKAVRYFAIGAFFINYAWVVYAHTQLGFH